MPDCSRTDPGVPFSSTGLFSNTRCRMGCKNRHCPKCQNEQADKWLAEQRNLLLPVTHFFMTFTLPAQLRAVARSNQKTIYNILFRASAEALRQLALDPRFVGGRFGMVGLLHTWTRALVYHPHVHYIVTGGGLTEAGRWLPSRMDWMVLKIFDD